MKIAASRQRVVPLDDASEVGAELHDSMNRDDGCGRHRAGQRAEHRHAAADTEGCGQRRGEEADDDERSRKMAGVTFAGAESQSGIP